MGNCPSTSRRKFSPNQECSKQVTAEIVLKPVDEDEKIHFSDSEDEKVPFSDSEDEKSIPMIDGVEENEIPSITNGSGGDAKLKADDNEVPLIVELVHLCIPTNTLDHHTNDFHVVHGENPRLVLRRGSPFKINVDLNRAFDASKDILCLVFTLKGANSPSYSQNTEVLIPVVLEDEKEKVPAPWEAKVLEAETKTLTLEVTPAPNCIVGEWILEVDSRLKDDKNAPDFRYKVNDPIFILFNPWCEADTVYLEGEEKREEYVLADTGLVWRGSHNCLRPCVWNYAQFEENILECCLYLLTNVGHLRIVDRADPISVVRHVSAVLNCRDDNGVLVGNWSGKYKGGKPPTCWGGSQVILQKYFKNKKPVKYGQCWVFSGVFTTVCRALGIPCRPVTNFSSAHDTHNSLTIDRFFDCHGKPLEKMNIDSVWNFHVWNEVWMQRPDLEPGGYGGWQAADCTPQEESDGLYRCGPASVAAIKRGEVKKAFDTTFLFAEVNADKVYWRYHGPNQPLKLIKKSTEEIGQCISTKAVGKFEREDITHEYKHLERSKEEREVMLRALRQCKDVFSRYYLNDDLEDVQFEFTLLDDIVIGEPFTVKLKALNKKDGGDEFTVSVSLHVHSALYTGESKKLIKKDEFQIKLGPGVEQEMTMRLEYAEYEKSLVDQCAFLISAMAHVEETGFDYCAQDDFRVRMPDISIQVDGEIVQNQPITVTATLSNPLPKPLKGGEFIIEGPGFGKPTKLKMKGNIPPGEDAKVKCKLTPNTCGCKAVIAKFRSKELEDVDGYHTIYVKACSDAQKDSNCHL
ncbi:annulin-like isoform X1 [Argiope bruennichi]|uniref:annulin-like isoform X1 n=1 Tax=Argiope bruennichi TaxID=94029 RepID=UPI002494FF8C|nr:annulin-like isoform X1 [Argiope bruennichi]